MLHPTLLLHTYPYYPLRGYRVAYHLLTPITTITPEGGTGGTYAVQSCHKRVWVMEVSKILSYQRLIDQQDFVQGH